MNLNRNLLGLFLVLFLPNILFAQKGYIGMTNEFTIEPLGIPLRNTLALQYKKMLSPHFGLVVSYERFSITNSGRTLNVPELSVYDNFSSNINYMDYYMPLEISKPVYFAGSTFGLGLVGSSKYANLNAPIGYYFGYNWALFKGASELTFKIPDAFVPYKYASVPTNYDIKYSILELINTLEIGKEYYLDHHLTIAGGIQFGYALHIENKTSNTYNNLIYNNNDLAIVDNSFPLYPYHSPEFIENIYGEYVNLGLIRFFVTPKLRIGYLF